MTILGPNGQPMASSQFAKASPPKQLGGGGFGPWAGRELQFLQLPGGGVVQFDLSRLNLADYRSMRDHYQVNASLAVLTFMIHQVDWHIKIEGGGRQDIADFCEYNLKEQWTQLIRAVSQAYWAGYAPTAVEFDNDITGRRVVISRFKDLVPEECRVNWNFIEGYAPPGYVAKPLVAQFDGIRRYGSAYPIPVENSFWYPALMENGDYYGRKLLKPAFTSWFFSILMHLFSNRYFERFGEPVPVGRADLEQEVTMDGTTMSGYKAMEQILTNLRNRSVVVLPSDRVPVGTSGNQSEYAFDIEYLESQMRGADFERYLTRLDEEISLALFTPLLLLRTADVGSHNLGVGHMQIYLWMLNALAGDLKEYIDKYLLSRLVDYNFGPNAPRAKWEFVKMGKQSAETVRFLIQTLMANGAVKPNVQELGDIVGLDLKEVQILTDPNNPGAPPADSNPNPSEATIPGKGAGGNNPGPRPVPKGRGSSGPRDVNQAKATGRQISNRIQSQVEKAFRDGTFGKTFAPSLGFRRRFEESLRAEGFDNASESTETVYTRMNSWLGEVIALGPSEFENPTAFMGLFDRMLETEIEELASAG